MRTQKVILFNGRDRIIVVADHPRHSTELK